MVVAVGRAAESGARAVVCASTGNTAASAAAYAARAGLASIVLTPAGATATAKRAQAVAVGARLLEVRGSFDDALRICRELGERPGYVLVNSLNPDRIEGQKTVVFELLEALGSAPEIIALPFGGGGNVSAVAAGLAEAGASSRIVVGQAAERATTWATAIRIAQPAHAEHVAGLVASGRVEVVTLSEDEIRTPGSSSPRLRARSASPPLLPATPRWRVSARATARRGLHSHRPRPQGHRRARRLAGSDGRRREPRGRPGGARMSMHAVAPASTANLGPAFDSAAAALELWNEVVVEETPVDDGRDRGRGRRRAAARREPSGVARVRTLRAGRGLPLQLRQPDPARARPRLECRGDRARRRRGQQRRRRAPDRRGAAGRAASSRDTATISLPRCSAASASRGRDAAEAGDADRRRPAARVDPRRSAGRINTAQSRNGLPATVPHRTPPQTPRRRGDARRGDRRRRRQPAARRVPRPAARAVPQFAPAPLLELRAKICPMVRAASRSRAPARRSSSGSSPTASTRRCRARAVRSPSATVLPLRVAQAGAHVQ